MASYDVIILGAGAAGLMCAMTAGQRGRRVLVIDHAPKAGAKILISGGGRCNFTNLHSTPSRFISANPHFAKSALSRYTQHDFISLIERHRIPYHEKTLGQLFCDGSARSVVAMLLGECESAGVALRLGCRVTDVGRSGDFRVETDAGAFTAASLVLATGGPSIPKMGATGFAYDVARRFGLGIVAPRAALVPLRMTGEMLQLCQSLAGISVEAIVACGRQSFRENILFTHRGLSGPAILQISSYWREGEDIALDLTPDLDAENYLKDRKQARPKAELKSLLAEILPSRLAQALAPTGAVMANLSSRNMSATAENLQRWRMTPAESEGWGKAEVALGGIDAAGLSSKTMEARGVPGLYAIGEAVDVTGWLGGYNFQWAWSSGWVAGQSA